MKNLTKKCLLPVLFLTLFLLTANSAQAQTPFIVLTDQEEVVADSTKIGIYTSAGSTLTRIRLNNETDGKSSIKDISGDQLLTSADTIVFPIDRLPFQTKDRDVFRIGVGDDLFKLFKKDDAPK